MLLPHSSLTQRNTRFGVIETVHLVTFGPAIIPVNIPVNVASIKSASTLNTNATAMLLRLLRKLTLVTSFKKFKEYTKYLHLDYLRLRNGEEFIARDAIVFWANAEDRRLGATHFRQIGMFRPI